MGGQNFKIRIFQIWKQIWTRLKKIWKSFPFFDILIGSTPKTRAKSEKIPDWSFVWTYPVFEPSNAFLTVLLKEYQKKESTLHSYFFERNSNLQSDLKNSHFEILTSHRWGALWPYPYKTPYNTYSQSNAIFAKLRHIEIFSPVKMFF